MRELKKNVGDQASFFLHFGHPSADVLGTSSSFGTGQRLIMVAAPLSDRENPSRASIIARSAGIFDPKRRRNCRFPTQPL